MLSKIVCFDGSKGERGYKYTVLAAPYSRARDDWSAGASLVQSSTLITGT